VGKWPLGLPSDDYPDPPDVRVGDSMAREKTEKK